MWARVDGRNIEEVSMKRILLAASVLAIVGTAALTPASAQVFLGADNGGVGVQVGPGRALPPSVLKRLRLCAG